MKKEPKFIQEIKFGDENISYDAQFETYRKLMEAEDKTPAFSVSEEVGLIALGIGNDIPAEMARIEVQNIRSFEERVKALKSLSEQYPVYFEKLRAEKERRSMMLNRRMMKAIWFVIFLLIVWLLMSK